MSTWRGVPDRPPVRPGAGGWLRALARGIPMALLVFGGLGVLLMVRLVERPLCGPHRPVTPWITRGVCTGAVAILGLRLRRRGAPMTGIGAMVANHSSWLDIFVLNASANVVFVSKAEVAGWPGIGWLARATGTLFIRREAREAAMQTALIEERITAGQHLLFFPEGTSTDGCRVLPFKTTLFQAFFADGLRHVAEIQPVTVSYRPPEGAPHDAYGWWGDMSFGANLLEVLAMRRHGSVDVLFHETVPVDEVPNRKTLAHRLETIVRDDHAPSQM
ncbi:lysophospholipid acyltransferase family protein [Roseivivax sediminis]|uniref:Lyso-ornithine lipid acyltransferase n=1 Tax=Roseivivax sediminis TaxID=936889 RepID=A0A1I1YZB8_9RHOB|nr:lysophospholipid acyltransferase family protein [Roseivivax sediminis]SFE23523.1 lyso-ornithine lipid acyltransferase [Roseivivax sediminis]